jgi:hypothetical protein
VAGGVGVDRRRSRGGPRHRSLARGRGAKLVEEKRIWDEGVVARDPRGSVHFDDRTVFVDSAVEIHYTDDQAATHHRKLELTTLRRLDSDAPVAVHYLKGHPGELAISAAVDRLPDRWIVWYLTSAIAAMMALGVLVLAGLQLQKWLAIRLVAHRSDEVELPIEHIERVAWGHHGGVTWTQRFRYHCRHSAGGKTTQCSAVFYSALGKYPIFTDDAQSRLVALVSPHAPRRPVIVRNDLHPFVLDPQQRERLKKRLRAGGWSVG